MSDQKSWNPPDLGTLGVLCVLIAIWSPLWSPLVCNCAGAFWGVIAADNQPPSSIAVVVLAYLIPLMAHVAGIVCLYTERARLAIVGMGIAVLSLSLALVLNTLAAAER